MTESRACEDFVRNWSKRMIYWANFQRILLLPTSHTSAYFCQSFVAGPLSELSRISHHWRQLVVRYLELAVVICSCRLQELGLEKGWGNTAGRVVETIKLLEDLLQAPDPDTLEKFLARIPMVFSVVIVTPHGYFGQDGVLGLPDTGGQVVYILDQVRALENEMLENLQLQGLDIVPKIVIVRPALLTLNPATLIASIFRNVLPVPLIISYISTHNRVVRLYY